MKYILIAVMIVCYAISSELDYRDAKLIEKYNAQSSSKVRF